MDKKNRRIFWLSMGFSLFVLLTLTGFVAVDYQGRRLSFGDSTPPVHVDRLENGEARLEIKAFGMEKSWDFTKVDEFFDFLCEFGCIPHN